MHESIIHAPTLRRFIMAKMFTRSHVVVIRDDAEARARNWSTDQEDYFVRSLGRGLWSVRVINDDDTLGRAVHVRTAELERRYLRRPETEVRVYKA